jgi:hypothetical protein
MNPFQSTPRERLSLHRGRIASGAEPINKYDRIDHCRTAGKAVL